MLNLPAILLTIAGVGLTSYFAYHRVETANLAARLESAVEQVEGKFGYCFKANAKLKVICSTDQKLELVSEHGEAVALVREFSSGDVRANLTKRLKKSDPLTALSNAARLAIEEM